MISKILLQGSPERNIEHRAYVKSIWIDYSDDDSTWKCHNASDGEIALNYDTSCDELNVFGFKDNANNMDKCAAVKIWPPINARFIRLRPCDYHKEIALRFDLYGPPSNRVDHARVVKFGDLSTENRREVIKKFKHCEINTRIIQVDCAAVIRHALDQAHMTYVGFIETDKNNYLCVLSTADLTATERTIEELLSVGIGRAMGVVGICPMQFRRPAKQAKKSKDEEEKENKEFQTKHGVTAGFYSSIKSRQIVDQLVDQTTQSAEFTYDYMSMLLVANVIAAMGLGTNSAVIVVASMLVSPIMGPVLALTFGVHLRKFKFARALWKLGIKNECWSLLICIVEGFIVGFVLISATENEGQYTWPTEEMSGRGNPAGLATGAIVAFASGVGVALSVVGDYMATVIGVAISASLLPPAVNCGMLWAMSLYVYIWPDRGGGYDAEELAVMGTISIVLTIENIILVFLASWMMFIIKDVSIGKDRGFDDNNKQLVYQSITSFKERYDDVKMRASISNLPRGMSMKRLALQDTSKNILGKGLHETTVDSSIKGATLKKTLMAYNTVRGGRSGRYGAYGGRGGSMGGISRAVTELDGLMEEDDEDGDMDDFGGHSKIRLNVQSGNNQNKAYEPLNEALTEAETENDDEAGVEMTTK